MLSPRIRSPQEDRRLLSSQHQISDTTNIMQLVQLVLSSQPWWERGDGTWHQMRTLLCVTALYCHQGGGNEPFTHTLQHRG